MKSVSVSIEELIILLFSLEEVNVAKDYFKILTQDKTEQEANAALMTATHSLLAREYIDVDIKNNKYHVHECIKEILHIFCNSDHSIRMSKLIDSQEEILVFHFLNKKVISHKSEGFAQKFTLYKNENDLIDAGFNFLHLNVNNSTESYEIPLKGDILELLKDKQLLENPFNIKEKIRQFGVQMDASEELAVDLLNIKCFSSMNLIEHNKNEFVSNAGAIVLEGLNNTWIFLNNNEEFTLIKGTEESIRKIIRFFWKMKYGTH